MNNQTEQTTTAEIPFHTRVWQTTSIVCLILIIIIIVHVAFIVLLMALAGILVAVYFHAMADSIRARLKISAKTALAFSVAGTLILALLIIGFIGSTIENQVAVLSSTLPKSILDAKQKLSGSFIGSKILEYSSPGQPGKMLDTATSFLNSGLGVFAHIYIILFLGFFFTASPALYKNGILFLFPTRLKPAGKIIMERVSSALKGWLKSIIISMFLITILVTIGLAIIGLPVTMVLGLITGILEIMPNFGPVIAMIPGVLLGFTISTKTAVVVALTYIICQTVVENIISPLIIKRMIHLPPALTLISQLIMGILSGILGVILAVPLLAILTISIDELYLRKPGTEPQKLLIPKTEV